jgi:hypothetical protein
MGRDQLWLQTCNGFVKGATGNTEFEIVLSFVCQNIAQLAKIGWRAKFPDAPDQFLVREHSLPSLLIESRTVPTTDQPCVRKLRDWK